MDITFESKQEATDFYRSLPASFREANHVLPIQNRLHVRTETEADCKLFARFFSRFIMDNYEKRWLTEIIEKHYLFTEAEEKIAILNIVAAIFAGEKNDLPETDELPDRKQFMLEALEGILSECSVLSFQSILRFRLTAYRKALRRFVEIAIDEYKLEQEYQVFIDKLRRIIRAYKPLCDRIEVIDGVPFKLYDDRHRPIKNMQSVRSFYPLLKQWGIEAEPSMILTLIALAPKQVIVYTDRPEHGMMKTLHRVFEDRVCFLPGEFGTGGRAGNSR
ncbi:hypothetical protein EWH99_01535 [Sporolactobacillus sp. THM7-7]|nr:hypothetical protein EWH99_01535 [Sporolactobacillus sp. THM7-7]